MACLDLNADLGEGMAHDAELLALVSSASIACGGHAGTEASMRAALRGAKTHGVVAGYHPGFADPEHFGRRRLTLGIDDLVRQLRDQMQALDVLAREEGVPLRYIKLHGALANMAAEDEQVASVCFATARSHDAHLAVLAIDNSAQVTAAEALGMTVVREAYADRAYRADGLLLARGEPGAVIHDVERVGRRAVMLATAGELAAFDGTVLKTTATSLCLHGDTDGAVTMARHVRDLLAVTGVTVASPLA